MAMSDFLFVEPSFSRGLARTLDVGAVLGGSSYNISPTGDFADAWATSQDWHAIGRDIMDAFLRYQVSLPAVSARSVLNVEKEEEA